MDFKLTEDRQMLSDLLRRFFADRYGFEAREKVAHDYPYHAPDKWAELAELGVMGVFVGEAQGGFGGTGFDVVTVFEEIGRALCPEPILGTLMSLQLLADFKQDVLIEEIIAGKKRPALAVFEPEAGERLADLVTVATQDGDQWRLTGRKSVVYGVAGADLVLVVARCDDGLGLFHVDKAEIIDYAMIDGGGAGEVFLDNTPAICLAEGIDEALEDALDAGRVALCAEAIGAMDVLLEMTVDYLKQRSQFGRPIASFQALQHRVVDLAVEVEQARSITILAASKLETEERRKYVSMAKNLIGRVAPKVGEEAIQLHGGIGMTWEYPGSHYAKRLIMLDQQLGDRFVHLNRLVSTR